MWDTLNGFLQLERSAQALVLCATPTTLSNSSGWWFACKKLEQPAWEHDEGEGPCTGLNKAIHRLLYRDWAGSAAHTIQDPPLTVLFHTTDIAHRIWLYSSISFFYLFSLPWSLCSNTFTSSALSWATKIPDSHEASRTSSNTHVDEPLSLHECQSDGSQSVERWNWISSRSQQENEQLCKFSIQLRQHVLFYCSTCLRGFEKYVSSSSPFSYSVIGGQDLF